jgi:hypothetical protein
MNSTARTALWTVTGALLIIVAVVVGGSLLRPAPGGAEPVSAIALPQDAGEQPPADATTAPAHQPTQTGTPEIREHDGRRETRTQTSFAEETFAAADAGAVTVRNDGDTLHVVDVTSTAGWTSRTERASGSEVEVKFLNEGRRVDFAAEFEHGGVRIKVRERER